MQGLLINGLELVGWRLVHLHKRSFQILNIHDRDRFVLRRQVGGRVELHGLHSCLAVSWLANRRWVQKRSRRLMAMWGSNRCSRQNCSGCRQPSHRQWRHRRWRRPKLPRWVWIERLPGIVVVIHRGWHAPVKRSHRVRYRNVVDLKVGGARCRGRRRVWWSRRRWWHQELVNVGSRLWHHRLLVLWMARWWIPLVSGCGWSRIVSHVQVIVILSYIVMSISRARRSHLWTCGQASGINGFPDYVSLLVGCFLSHTCDKIHRILS